MDRIDSLQHKIDRLRQRGFGGTAIQMHRAIFRVELEKRNRVLSMLLPFVFTFLQLCFLGPVIAFWRFLFRFWLDRLEPGSAIASQAIDLGHYMVWIHYPGLSADYPSAATWWITLSSCALIWLATMLVSPNRYLPLIYIVRACLLIQGTALAYFNFLPGQFPYDGQSYLGNALVMALLFMFMVPWILGLTYYVFNFSIRRKIALTALVLGYFVVAFPMQYLLHAIALHYLSLLFMPLFYLVFGTFLDVMMFVALYSWGMSWKWGREAGLAKAQNWR